MNGTRWMLHFTLESRKLNDSTLLLLQIITIACTHYTLHDAATSQCTSTYTHTSERRISTGTIGNKNKRIMNFINNRNHVIIIKRVCIEVCLNTILRICDGISKLTSASARDTRFSNEIHLTRISMKSIMDST